MSGEGGANRHEERERGRAGPERDLRRPNGNGRSSRLWVLLSEKPVEVLLGAMALIVSAAAVFVAVQANRIAGRQAQIAEAQVQPLITATTQYTFEGGAAKSESMVVRNEGGPADGFDVSQISLLSIEYLRRDKAAVTRVVPVDYYTAGVLTGRPTGQLARFEGDPVLGNNEHMSRLDRRCREFANQRSEILLLDLEQFLHVTYTDRIGKAHSRYYIVETVGGSYEIDPERGRRAFELEAEPRFSIYEATPEDVIAAWRASRRDPP